MKDFSTLKEKFCISVQPRIILSVFFCLLFLLLIITITIIICATQFLWKYSTAPYKWGGGGHTSVCWGGIRGSSLCHLRLQTQGIQSKEFTNLNHQDKSIIFIKDDLKQSVFNLG